MSLLDHPTAQALLADAEVSAAAVAGCPRRLQRFPQVGLRLLRRAAAVVRPARQDRELSTRRLPGLRQRRRDGPGGPPAVLAPRVGHGRAAAPAGARARGGAVPGELADRPGPD